MRPRENSSIFFPAVFFLVLCSVRSTLSDFRIHDLKINQYYLGSSHIFSIEDDSKVKKRDIGKEEFIFSLKLDDGEIPVRVLIKKRKSDLVHENTRIIHISDDKNESKNRNLDDIQLYEGYILGTSFSSSINGYIQDNCFYGHVIVNNTFYYVDEIDRLGDNVNISFPEDDEQKQNALIYNKHFITFSGLEDLIPLTIKLPQFTEKDLNPLFQVWKGKGMLCPLVIVMDYSFLITMHRGNVEAATSHVLFSLEEVNAVFRSTDFNGDGSPDNIGFYVKKIVVLTSDTELYYTVKYTTDSMDVNDFIQKFKRYKELENHCLGLMFTAQKFTLKTLGASFSADHKRFITAGGICDSTVQGRSFNALVITVVTARYNPVPQLIFEITIAHELGHSFGSSHDPASKGCNGYLMAPRTFDDYDTNVMRTIFSNCSKETILKTLVIKGSCLEPVTTSFCGNGIVESDEECDCGLTRVCLEKDPCCTPRRTGERPCRTNRKIGFDCHPSQGECCTEQCKYNPSLQTFVNCQHFEHTCPCTRPFLTCSCGINGMCVGNECHSIECTRLGLDECRCQKDRLNGLCSVCCMYNGQCVSVLQATQEVISEETDGKIFEDLVLNKRHTENTGKNWILRRYCLPSNAGKTHDCADLRFFQAPSNDYCLFNGRLGRCNRTGDCDLFPIKQVFPDLQSNSHRKKNSFFYDNSAVAYFLDEAVFQCFCFVLLYVF